jgi:hypothetical protein
MLRCIQLQLDESTNFTDTAKLATFIPGVNEGFVLVEQHLKLLPVK